LVLASWILILTLMTIKTQKLITTISISLVVIGGFEALIYILNLNDPFRFLRVAFYIYIYLALKMALLYDLHFKNTGALKRARTRHESIRHWLSRTSHIWASAIHDRFQHLMHWKYLRHFFNYLLLPGLVYWGTICLIYLNFGRLALQQTFALLSSAALIVCYWYLKEIFYRKKERVDADIFNTLSVIKLYAAFLLYAGSLGITRHFCLETHHFVIVVFILTFWLMYQAMFQHGFLKGQNLFLALFASFCLAGMAYFVYVYWGLNIYTAGVFLLAWYNFLWGILHHYLEHEKFSWKVFAELFLITILVTAMMFGVTNFKARLLNAC
jgi:hypothetical protein